MFLLTFYFLEVLETYLFLQDRIKMLVASAVL